MGEVIVDLPRVLIPQLSPQVNANTGQPEQYPAVTLQMGLIDLTVLQGTQASAMSLSVLERMRRGPELAESLGELYDGDMCALGGMVRSGSLDVLEKAVEMIKDEKLMDKEVGKMLMAVKDSKGSDLPFGACASGQLGVLKVRLPSLQYGITSAVHRCMGAYVRTHLLISSL